MSKDEYIAELRKKIEDAEEAIILLEPIQCLTKVVSGVKIVYGVPKWAYPQVLSEEAELATVKIAGYKNLIEHYRLKIKEANSMDWNNK